MSRKTTTTALWVTLWAAVLRCDEEIAIFDQSAMPFAQDLGEALEREFEIAEATIVERPGPA